MNIRLSAILYMFVFLFFSACTNQEKQSNHKIENLEWITGKWKAEEDGTIFLEYWSKGNNMLNGTGYIITDGDTVLSEKIVIEKRGDSLYYVTDVPENHSKVAFKLVKLVPNHALFKNPKHDFPKRITYIYNQPDNLYAKIEGRVSGEKKEKEFFFKKIN